MELLLRALLLEGVRRSAERPVQTRPRSEPCTLPPVRGGAMNRDLQIEELVRLIYGPADPSRLRLILALLLPGGNPPSPRVEVHDMSGNGTGPFRLMVNGYGICKWPPAKDCEPK